MTLFQRTNTGFKVAADASSTTYDFEVSTTGAARFTTTIAVGSLLQPTVTVGANASAVSTLRFLEVTQSGGTKIFVPYVSALPN